MMHIEDAYREAMQSDAVAVNDRMVEEFGEPANFGTSLAPRRISKHDEAYRRCSAAGMSIAETAREVGVAKGSVCMWAKANGVSFRDGRKS